MSKGIRKIREMMQQPSIGELGVQEIEPGSEVVSDEEIATHVHKTAGTVYHPVGTCKIGYAETAVVDYDLKVIGVEGLRVIDASIMTNIISGNTNASAFMNGEKGAAHVLADSGGRF